MTISVPQCVEVIIVRCCDGISPLHIYRGLPCNEVHCTYFCVDSFIVRFVSPSRTEKVSIDAKTHSSEDIDEVRPVSDRGEALMTCCAGPSTFNAS